MYWTIDASPNVQPDLDGEGMKLPGWNDRKGYAFKGEGSAGLRMTEGGHLAIIDTPKDREMFRVTRRAVLKFTEMGTRIYKYSDWIGPLLVTIDIGPGLKMALPREVFLDHRDRALALIAAYDKENARLVNMRA